MCWQKSLRACRFFNQLVLVYFFYCSAPCLCTEAHRGQSGVSFQDLDPWSRYVHGFRKDHNLALSFGRAKGVWQLERFGSLHKREFSSSAYFLKAQYSFHLRLWGSFGYALGSSVGVMYDALPRGMFNSTWSYHLPGAFIAAVYNLSPSLRLSVGIDNYLERIEGLSENQSGFKNSLDANMNTWLDTSVSIDYFRHLKSAIRAEIHLRRSRFRPLAGTTESGYQSMEASSFGKAERWFALGWVYHFL